MKMLKSYHFIYQNSKILILDPDIFRTRENFATKTCRDEFSFLEKLILKYIDNLISDVKRRILFHESIALPFKIST